MRPAVARLREPPSRPARSPGRSVPRGPSLPGPRAAPTGLLVALLLLLAGCDDGSDAVGPASAGEGQVRGVVARQKTAQGVPGVPVALLRSGTVRQVTVTGADGAFAFDGLDGGGWTVRPAATELAGLDVRYDAMEPPEHAVTVGGEPVELVFAVVGLVPPRITGRVTCGGSGDPGATLRVVGGATDVTTSPDATGLYSVLELDPGHYAVLVQGAACTVSPAYRVVELRPGQLAEADFQGAGPTAPGPSVRDGGG